jgi:DNA-directed RNA polymerase specialized sigma24 family protein
MHVVLIGILPALVHMTTTMTKPQTCDLLRAFQSHYDTLRAFLTRQCGSVTLAAEVVQEMYIRLQQLTSMPPVQEPRAYLLQMAMNFAIDHLHARERQEKAV